MVSLEKNILPIIESVSGSLTHLEKKIASYFLSGDLGDDDLSAKAVAERLYVSVPSLTRFAKKCGFKGYRQFIYEFQESSQTNKNVSRNLTKNVLSDYGELLSKTFSLIDEEQFLRVGQMLNTAQRVYIYGQGSSGLVAQEMEFRFMRLGMVCKAITDAHMIRMNAVMVNQDCLVIGISMSGQTKIIVNAISNAKKAGARTVLITSNNSENLREQCDELVLVAMKKLLAQGNNISPQFPVLVVIDIFYAYYVDLDRDTRNQIFTTTLSALAQEEDDKGQEKEKT
ncbi:MurR/RpiR family transcriptional regulator [Streptococcus oricebi]|uniref:RpiR family transcriptional regulator n=1 Tax=Streptococcus oricebi TaxID=1547447 RepID=A0ABS5B5V3_9STRE|nr:MurR/RpiR family transcriptional regulator [Streptococcus oricebi]MBP2624223.1 RpiR family transcriptional regulator [Streptococcus oricebi]